MDIARLIKVGSVSAVSLGTPTVYFSVITTKDTKQTKGEETLIKRFNSAEEAKNFWLEEGFEEKRSADARLGTAVFFDRYWLEKDEEFEGKTKNSSKNKSEIKTYCENSKNEVIEINRESVDGSIKIKYRKKGETNWKEYLEDIVSLKETIDLCTNNYTYEHIYKDKIFKDSEWEDFYEKVKERVWAIAEGNAEELKIHCDSEKIKKYSIKTKSSDFWMKCTKWEEPE